MSKTIQEQIEVMQHYLNFNDGVYQLYITTSSAISEEWKLKSSFPFDWQNYDYRIKEQKKTITIEKWLVQFDDGEYRIMQSSDIKKSSASKIKLLETYEVEL